MNATVDAYRVSIYEESTDLSGYLDVKWVYEGGESKLADISVIRTFAGGPKDRWLYEISVDTSSLGLLLSSNATYYISLEGDCVNTEDVYNGYDTYYQRFYMLSGVDTASSTQTNNNHWYSGEFDNGWTEAEGDLVWAIEGHQIPEPATLGLLGLGSFALGRRKVRGRDTMTQE